MTIRIFLIDEHRPTREILARRLASMPGLDVVGSASAGESAIREIAGLSSDVVLIETKVKRSDVIAICRRALVADDQSSVLRDRVLPTRRTGRELTTVAARANQPSTLQPIRYGFAAI